MLPRASSRAPRLNAYRRGGRHCIGTSAWSTSCLHGAAAQTANRGQEGGGAGHAGRGRNAARWLRSLRALLLCWLPAALLHWRRTQRALASELSSGMPDDHDTALHSTRMQPIRPINLARAGAHGPMALPAHRRLCHGNRSETAGEGRVRVQRGQLVQTNHDSRPHLAQPRAA